MRLVVLDSGPVGLITNPRVTPANEACNLWLRHLLERDQRIALPAIIDYEIRRELLLGRKAEGLKRLDALKRRVEYLPVTTDSLLKAAELWALARQQGRPTADRHALDIDVILAAQAMLAADGDEVVVATTNVGHLSRFVQAELWQEIQ
jgi:predicted nucleic acid-binding protein